MRFIMVQFATWQEDDDYVARCIELGTVSQGHTEEEAISNLEEATLLYLNTLEELGECEQVLKEKSVPIRDLRPMVGPPMVPPQAHSPANVRSAVLPVAACV